MKKLKLILVIITLISCMFIWSSHATNCTWNDAGMWIYDCQIWQYCPTTGNLLPTCTCQWSKIDKWNICWTACTEDPTSPWVYNCNKDEYCPSWAIACTCNWSSINIDEVCDSYPTPPRSCNRAWQIFFWSRIFYKSWTVPYWERCEQKNFTCTNWTISPGFYTDYTASYCIILPPPTWSCTVNWNFLENWETLTVFQDTSPDFGSSCNTWTITCSNWTPTWNTSWTATSCTPDDGSCIITAWRNISHWQTVTAYKNSSVSCWSSCESKQITCTSWALNDTSYKNKTCSASCGWWGGWSSTPICELEDLVCLDWVYEKKDWIYCRYWDLWEPCTESSNWWSNWDHDFEREFDRIWDISHSPYSDELNLAYLYAYNIWITDMPTIQKANMYWNLLRAQMAKMLVNRSKDVLWLKTYNSKWCDFDDIEWLKWQDLYEYTKEACELWLMWLSNYWQPTKSFNPYWEVSRWQFGTVLSRAIWWDKYNYSGTPFYKDHLQALKDVSIMKKIYTPEDLELRWRVMLMLMRTEQLLK